MTRNCRNRQQRKSDRKGQWLQPREDRREHCEQRAHSRQTGSDDHRRPEPSRQRHVMQLPRGADEDDQERQQHQAHRYPGDREPEERRPDRDEEAGKEQGTRDHVLRARPVARREGGQRGSAAGSHAEGDRPRDLVAVVGQSAPEHRVVAVAEPATKRDDERPASDDARLPGKYRAAAVADRFHTGAGADGVVENEPDGGRSFRDDSFVRRNGADQPRVRPRRRRKGERTEHGEHKTDAKRHRRIQR